MIRTPPLRHAWCAYEYLVLEAPTYKHHPGQVPNVSIHIPRE